MASSGLDPANPDVKPRTPRILDPKKIDSLPPGGTQGVWYSDPRVKGLALVCFTRAKTFVVRFRVADGRRRTIKLGEWGEITLEEARRRARRLRGQADGGIDPVAETERAREIPTWREWVATYVKRIKGRLRSWRDVKGYLNRTLARWGHLRLDEITPPRIASLMEAQKGVAGKNRFRSSVSGALAEAVRDGYLSENAAARVRPGPEPEPRRRVPTDREMTLLFEAFDQEAEDELRVLFWFLALTGARGSEALLMKWEDVDLDARVAVIPRAKSGRRETIPLTDSLVSMLEGLRRRGPYVFPGRAPKKKTTDSPAGGAWKPRHDLQAPWDRVLHRAGLGSSGLHLHDLRRLAGKDLTEQGGTRVAADVLRHSDERVTRNHYSPKDVDRLRGFVEQREQAVLRRTGRAK